MNNCPSASLARRTRSRWGDRSRPAAETRAAGARESPHRARCRARRRSKTLPRARACPRLIRSAVPTITTSAKRVARKGGPGPDPRPEGRRDQGPGQCRMMRAACSGASHPRSAITAAQLEAGLVCRSCGRPVHRDVKPANVLIEREGGLQRAYLSDLGLTKNVGSTIAITPSGSGSARWTTLRPSRSRRGGWTPARTSTPWAACSSRRRPAASRRSRVRPRQALGASAPRAAVLRACAERPCATRSTAHLARAQGGLRARAQDANRANAPSVPRR